MGFWKLAWLFSLALATGCVVAGATDIGGSPDASAAGGNGRVTPSAWELNPDDFTRPWIRLSVPTGTAESVISLTPDPRGYMALVRYDDSVGKVIGAVTHRLAWSADGLNWSSWDFDSVRDPSQGVKYYNSVAYGNGRYVVVGNAGAANLLRVSSDGLTWTSIATDGVGLWCARYTAGRWFAGGTIGYLATSLDGLAWSSQKLEEASINDLAFGNGVYVAAGNRSFWISSDGQTWEQNVIICDSAASCPGVTPPGSTFPQPGLLVVDTIFFVQGRFFARSEDTGYGFVSADGRQWQVVPREQFAPNLYVGGQFLAITADGVVRGSADATNSSLLTTLTDDNPQGLSCKSERCFVWKQNVILVPKQ